MIVGTYRRATKALLVSGVLMFTGFAGLSFWSAAFESTSILQSATFFALGALFAWLLHASVQIAPFIRCRIVVHHQGIRLCWPSVEKDYSWQSLGYFRDRPILQLIEVYDRDRNRILVFDYHLLGFGGVHASIAERVPQR
jgi:hypothetical protein